MADMLVVRGIRGAITVDVDEPDEIIAAARELVEQMIEVNDVDIDMIASVVFSATPDLTSVFPAVGGREAGLTNVPLFCTTEIDVPGAQPRCLRVLMHVNTTKKQDEIQHVYLREAVSLRPDLERR